MGIRDLIVAVQEALRACVATPNVLLEEELLEILPGFIKELQRILLQLEIRRIENLPPQKSEGAPPVEAPHPEIVPGAKLPPYLEKAAKTQEMLLATNGFTIEGNTLLSKPAESANLPL